MTANIIDGKKISTQLLHSLGMEIHQLKYKSIITPGLAVIQVGNDAASTIYVRNKIKCATAVGIDIFPHFFKEEATTSEIIDAINQLNNDDKVHGILVQLPLPAHMDVDLIVNTIDPKKDVDGFTWLNIGKLKSWVDCLEPCTPQGAKMLIKHAVGDDLSGKRVAILGRSRIVGRPMASMLLRANCTVTVLHSQSHNISDEVKRADIVIAATGVPNLIQGDWIKPGACVIDVGIIRIRDKLYGDVNFEEVKKVAGHITPVPGGVGPMTVACLMKNTVKAAKQIMKKGF